MLEPSAPNDPVTLAQPPRNTSQLSQERSLILFRPAGHQSPELLSRSSSPIRPTRPDDSLPTCIVEDTTDHGSVTPRPGDTSLHPLSRGGSQSPVPPRRDNGKRPQVQVYSDEEGMSESWENGNADSWDPRAGPVPRQQPDQVCLIPSCFGD